MSDRIIAYTVLLERPIKDEDAEEIRAAISMIRGVLEVREHVQDVNTLFAQETARHELIKKLWDVLQ
jgi:cell division protein FtsX